MMLQIKSVINKVAVFTFILLQMVSAANFGLLNGLRPKFTRLCDICTVLQIVAFASAYYFAILNTYVMDYPLSYWMCVTEFEFISNSLILISYSGTNSFFERFKSFQVLESKLSTNVLRGVAINFVILIFASVLSQLVYSYIICTYLFKICFRSRMEFMLFISRQQNFECTNVVSAFLFYIAYRLMKIYNARVAVCGNELNKYIFIYKEVVDNVHKVQKVFDYVYLVALIFKTPDIILMVYYSFMNLSVSTQAEPLNSLWGNLNQIRQFVILSSPAVSAGYLTYEVEKLKVILHNRLLEERDTKHADDIGMLLEYVTARPLKLTVFRILPLNWSFPVMLFNLCASYQIIVFQFTHVL